MFILYNLCMTLMQLMFSCFSLLFLYDMLIILIINYYYVSHFNNTDVQFIKKIVSVVPFKIKKKNKTKIKKNTLWNNNNNNGWLPLGFIYSNSVKYNLIQHL